MIKDKKYYIEDIESGHLDEVTEEVYKKYHAAIKLINNCKDKRIGKIMVFGTGGEFQNTDMEKLFYNPTPYKLVKFDNTFKDGDRNRNKW